ncbi:MAG: hypothetical protein ACLPX5_09645 [Dissulfurispiraceae bacterium]
MDELLPFGGTLKHGETYEKVNQHGTGRSMDSAQISGISLGSQGIDYGELNGLFVPPKQ